MRQLAAVDIAFFLAAVPAVARGHGQQRLELARQPRQMDALAGNALIQPFAVFAQQRGAHQVARPHLLVIGFGKDAVTVFGLFQHAAVARGRLGNAVFSVLVFKVCPEPKSVSGHLAAVFFRGVALVVVGFLRFVNHA